jgi:hypothetical protein
MPEWWQGVTFPNGERRGKWLTFPMMEALFADIDLAGKTVLEAGCMEGVCSLWIEQHGASVWPFDAYEGCRSRFAELKAAFGMDSDFHLMDLCDPWWELFPPWPAEVFTCLGVYYHLKSPLLGLEKAWDGTKNLLVIEGEVLPDEEREIMEFVPGEWHDNADKTCCWIPSRACLLAMVNSLGGVDRVEPIEWMPSCRMGLRVWRS